MQLRGKLHLDAGAVTALREQGKSLLPVGVRQIEGEFDRGDLLSCEDPDGREIARGLTNYNAAETAKILGAPSKEIASRLGYAGEPELIHRDNLVLTALPA